MSGRVDVLDHGYLELVDVWGSDERIVEAARMSTGNGFFVWGTRCEGTGRCWDNGDMTDCFESGCGEHERGVVGKRGDEKLLRFLWENKHHTPFEMAGMTVEVQAPIFVFREWHRHRVPFGYNEMSARYTPLPDLNYVPSVERLMLGSDGKNRQAGTVKDAAVPTEVGAVNFQHALSETYEAAEETYQWALKVGVPKELARVHLPVGRYSRMRATSNLRGWLAFLALRLAPSAQWEIRQYANAVGALVKERFPRTWGLFEEGLR